MGIEPKYVLTRRDLTGEFLPLVSATDFIAVVDTDNPKLRDAVERAISERKAIWFNVKQGHRIEDAYPLIADLIDPETKGRTFEGTIIRGPDDSPNQFQIYPKLD